MSETGRPPFEPTEEQRTQVRTLCACGFPHDQIAQRVGIAPKTLRKHFAEDLKDAKISANAMVAGSLFQKAMSDGPQSAAAAMFWLKTQARWKETTVSEHTGADGGPIVIQATPSDEAL